MRLSDSTGDQPRTRTTGAWQDGAEQPSETGRAAVSLPATAMWAPSLLPAVVTHACDVRYTVDVLLSCVEVRVIVCCTSLTIVAGHIALACCPTRVVNPESLHGSAVVDPSKSTQILKTGACPGGHRAEHPAVVAQAAILRLCRGHTSTQAGPFSAFSSQAQPRRFSASQLASSPRLTQDAI